LGKYEIATVQATAVDAAGQMVNLTTMLAHASGEWIASDWPVCPVVNIAQPQRMGAALNVRRNQITITSRKEIGMRLKPNFERPARRRCHGVGTSPIR
jgi:hypothetical protein